jgi:hypothetical protein
LKESGQHPTTTNISSNVANEQLKNFYHRQSSVSDDENMINDLLTHADEAFKPNSTFTVDICYDGKDRSVGYGIKNKDGVGKYFPRVFTNIFPEANIDYDMINMYILMSGAKHSIISSSYLGGITHEQAPPPAALLRENIALNPPFTLFNCCRDAILTTCQKSRLRSYFQTIFRKKHLDEWFFMDYFLPNLLQGWNLAKPDSFVLPPIQGPNKLPQIGHDSIRTEVPLETIKENSQTLERHFSMVIRKENCQKRQKVSSWGRRINPMDSRTTKNIDHHTGMLLKLDQYPLTAVPDANILERLAYNARNFFRIQSYQKMGKIIYSPTFEDENKGKGPGKGKKTALNHNP